jgi:hypothetical protein
VYKNKACDLTRDWHIVVLKVQAVKSSRRSPCIHKFNSFEDIVYRNHRKDGVKYFSEYEDIRIISPARVLASLLFQQGITRLDISYDSRFGAVLILGFYSEHDLPLGSVQEIFEAAGICSGDNSSEEI